ncbi:MBL fold metallo-hydrolase [Salinadaptatus halalkaliphilus]|uniref:MBL fold metallo-hydrolase n=1 Tax=Salinadaptatus halalkaliphilus TaxID=2419781 RepID=A0A4S3TM58_9EURY|nr:MBL fold metallo-hydrolase [Salinadaptatus halalkaliphilus]THE64690.1 MBL fold metallo-hydrolase [Salinadaptatus halalkaliphilus]
MDYERVKLVQPHYGAVNVYRIGATLVDTGHVAVESRNRLRDALEGQLSGIENVVLTHPHIDHIGGTLTVDDVTRLPHTVYEGADNLLREYPDYIETAREEMAALSAGLTGGEYEPDTEYFPLDIEYATERVAIDRVVGDGDTVQIGPYDCEVVHTPGHSQQHMSLYHAPSGVMLSGDIVSTNGHFMYGPLHWDIGAYKTGLERIRERDPDLLLPGHGEPMDDPAARVTDALEKARRTERAIQAAVEDQGPIAAHELAVEALSATDETVRFLSNVASAYAVHLAEIGTIDIDRRPYVVAMPA